MAAYIAKLGPQHRPWAWALTFDFSHDMVEGIKEHIPSRKRTYKPDTKAWWLRDDVKEVALSLAKLYCGEVIHESTAPLQGQADADFAALHLLPSAPLALVTAAYRILAKELHPDHGGDTVAMQRLNAAYKKLMQRR